MRLKCGKILCLLLGAALSAGACATTTLPYQADIMVANLDPIPLGTLDVGIIRLFSDEVTLLQVPVLYHPRTDAVTLELSVQSSRFRQFWTRRMREAFIRALTQYEADYAARNLPRSSTTRMGRAYATLNGKTEWRFFSITAEYQGFPLVDLGYNFKSGTPYFTVTQRKTEDVREPQTSNKVSSPHMVLYFTRSMAGELAALFDEEYLHLLIPDRYPGDNPLEEDFSGPRPAPVEDFDAPAVRPPEGEEE
ncbi:MAG: hypothetical protein LBQ35_04915 [Spirochaetaceae bacterium]|jgi:hypothetical protein|nr:hypothetical protein [Spirochaetaceae bacterium]